MIKFDTTLSRDSHSRHSVAMLPLTNSVQLFIQNLTCSDEALRTFDFIVAHLVHTLTREQLQRNQVFERLSRRDLPEIFHAFNQYFQVGFIFEIVRVYMRVGFGIRR